MKIPINFGAGGGSGSDDCTAAAADVLTGKTAIYNGTDDEPASGTMADYSGTTTSAALSQDSTNSRVLLTVPSTGKYDTSAKLYTSYSQMRTLIGYTDASKVLSGTTFLGLAGTMADKSGTTSSATSSLDSSNSRVRLQIPSNGYYNTSAYLYQTYSNIASLIGLTAAKLKYGETVLGVTGTWQGWVATSSDIYYNGSWGLLGSSTTNYGLSSGYFSFDTNCVSINPSKIVVSTNCGFLLSTALNCAPYSKITLTYQVSSAGSSSGSNDRIWLGLFSDTSTITYSNAYVYSRSSQLSSTGTFTLSIDLSSISTSLYVGVGFNCAASWSGAVTRIALS